MILVLALLMKCRRWVNKFDQLWMKLDGFANVIEKLTQDGLHSVARPTVITSPGQFRQGVHGGWKIA